MAEIITLKRKPRPLRKTYQPNAPYEVEREDQDDGSIIFYVTDVRPETFRTVAHTHDDLGRNAYAKFDAEQIARGLNLLVQYGKETLPKVRDTDDMELGDDDDE